MAPTPNFDVKFIEDITSGLKEDLTSRLTDSISLLLNKTISDEKQSMQREVEDLKKDRDDALLEIARVKQELEQMKVQANQWRGRYLRIAGFLNKMQKMGRSIMACPEEPPSPSSQASTSTSTDENSDDDIIMGEIITKRPAKIKLHSRSRQETATTIAQGHRARNARLTRQTSEAGNKRRG